MNDQHITVFKYFKNDLGFIQCVIKPSMRDDFFSDGFVDHVSKIKKPRVIRQKREVGNGNERSAS